MRILNAFINLLLLFLTPSFLIYPKGATSLAEIIIEEGVGDIEQAIPFEKVLPLMGLKAPVSNEFRMQDHKDKKISSYKFRYSADITYDDILDLIHAIEENRLQEPTNSDEVNRINQFIASLAQEGILESTPEFEKDREDLSPDIIDFLSILTGGKYESIDNPSKDLELTPSMEPIGGAWDKTKRFIEKHKQPIIIGAACVIAQTAVMVAIIAGASADSQQEITAK